jgi:alkyl sulfatase BDS1-like metallo-beta-lactamase superfamily hydrolase
MNRLPLWLLLGALTTALSACSRNAGVGGAAGDASASTVASNAAFASQLKLGDPQDFEDAKRGLIARPTGQIKNADGKVIRDFDAFQFLNGEAPPTVNPSLWRQAQLNEQIGLFKVTEHIYQVRGFDNANLTLVEGKTGWIVVDALGNRDSAAAAMAFATQHLGQKPVTALVLTHSHIDHFGGVLGVISPKEIAARKIPVVAPAAFMEEATSENIMVGIAMGRRSSYQFGKDLEPSAKGLVDVGNGKNVVYGGAYGIVAPNWLIFKPTQEMDLDGVHFVFHNVPGAECPAELTFTIPELKAYNGAENLAQTMHNLLPIRGAKVRDAFKWASYLDQALDQTKGMEVYFGQHNWPVWGNARIQEFVTKQRDVYKYTHDQTVRLINAGYTPREIADKVKLPASLENYFAARGYYGDLRHNVKAVYQMYLGAYDGNPANLNPLAPQDSAKRYMDAMGGIDKAVALAQTAFDKGDYRWSAELLNHAVFADATHTGAKTLLARTYEQMGYASESALWRNSYLTGAAELRNGPPAKGITKADLLDVLAQTPIERFLEAMAASLDGPAAEGKDLKINLVLTDTKESFVLWLENAVLHFRSAPADGSANATLTLTKAIFVKMIAGTAGVKDTLLSDDLKVGGSTVDLVRFFSLIDKAAGTFPIVTPK